MEQSRKYKYVKIAFKSNTWVNVLSYIPINQKNNVSYSDRTEIKD